LENFHTERSMAIKRKVLVVVTRKEETTLFVLGVAVE
jgi:hypothetical protein